MADFLSILGIHFFFETLLLFVSRPVPVVAPALCVLQQVVSAKLETSSILRAKLLEDSHTAKGVAEARERECRLGLGRKKGSSVFDIDAPNELKIPERGRMLNSKRFCMLS